MNSHRRGDLFIPFVTVVSDALGIECAFLFSYWLRFRSSVFDSLGFVREDAPPISGYVLGSLFVILVWVMLFHSRKMYASRRSVNLSDELLNVIRVTSFGMLMVMSATFFYREFSYSRVVVGLLWGTSITFIFAGRTITQSVERSLYRRGKHLQPAVIIGNDATANQVYSRLNNHPSFGLVVEGYFADIPATADLVLSKAPFLGTLADAPPYIQKRSIPLGLIALRPQNHQSLFELISRCEGVNIEFMLVPDVLEILTSQVRVRDLEGIPFLQIKSIPFTTWGRISKRAFDVLVSALTLVVFLPVLLIVAVLVKLDSAGSILFRQKRVGLDGREFTMLKFRSMREGSEQFDGEAGLGVRNDPRRTRVGKFLRSTSLDELPQLFNVLKGEMSLVGPRPERTHVVEEFQGVVPGYLDRHRVKTGVTGWAQVNGFRGDTSIGDRIKYDLYYIENWSIAFDIRILLRTLRAAFTFKEMNNE